MNFSKKCKYLISSKVFLISSFPSFNCSLILYILLLNFFELFMPFVWWVILLCIPLI